MEILNPVTMQLSGLNLIEASAGTGKTYTITGLYLRYLLGLRTPGEQTTPLSVEQILVVTFTEAATQEIKDRVRKRIIQARDVLLGEIVNDDLIAAILAQVTDKKRAFDLLDAAAKSMDEAAIFTIHGFCQRMLKQHAFESKVAFNLEFILDESELIEAAMADHWRRFVYPLDEEKTQAVVEQFATPYALAKQVKPLLSKENADIKPAMSLDAVFAAREKYQTLALWLKAEIVKADYLNVLKNAGLAGNRAPGRKANLQALEDYVNSEQWWFEFGSSNHSFGLWGSESLADPKQYKKNTTPLQHELIRHFDTLAELHHLVSSGLNIALVRQAVTEVSALLRVHKEEYGLISPDDLLKQLHQALLGDSGEALGEKIALQYPVAMIDEFQDTDPVQYGIFSEIYKREHTALTMIGDPKQAIYGFRGADIFTYIGAKKGIASHNQFTLATNYRSDSDVVAAVNTIFTRHPNSFIYNQDIPFIEVSAKGKAQDARFTINGEKHTALCFSALPNGDEALNKSAAQAGLSQAFAAKVAALIEKGQAGLAKIGEEPVVPADICILVRDRIEASLMKRALNQRGVASVYLARDSVFSQPLATALYQLLEVLHGSYDEAALRGVLAGPLFNLEHRALFELQFNEQEWQHYLQLFSELTQLWYRSGAMAMLEHLLCVCELPVVWRQKGIEVERWLTDFRHLAELLQHKQLELDGSGRVLRWFLSQLNNAQSDSSQIRLESDANLVKIVTMHASKGLEYPLVFMPFALGYRESDTCVYHQEGKLVVDLDAGEEAKESAEQERLAEDIRLLYVALTRAVHYCELGLYDIQQGRSKKSALHKTALGFVLFGAQTFDTENEWQRELSQLCDTHTAMAFTLVEQAQYPNQIITTSANEAPSRLTAKVFTGSIERHWRTTSFSQLSYHTHHGDKPAGAVDENHLLDLPEQRQEREKNAYTFPKGAKPGSCLHEIFELIDFTAPHVPQGDDKLTLTEAVAKSLDKYGIADDWQTPTEQWIASSLATPLLPHTELQLAQLKPEHCIVEMEFYLPLKPLSAMKLNKILSDITGQKSFLNFDDVKGMLKGFIDLIFQWQGQFFILDYKSNYLGDSSDDYQHDNLSAAMSSHQYHLQYMIYTVALHRLLKQRLPDYQVQQHLGGNYYLFLRALPDNQGIFFNQLSVEQVLQLDALFEESV
ncbi:exodeoxyribonuclease V subunit beta [Pseudoalteromonas peptidolytica]|uniref:RecBCD enzyme subunit RecB n=1 Tax=Pseudoalteromonas peptidolytica F12-50-A1 TaxID=1315280 RepID=A0A8I0T583_9GAMM|nr:exodeoxyribonuclease V subunit beta [Pseudoalteromonas peptidolytica]MBE0345964.1 exodeoxyribonuclease V beta subunit [Pseudoalteromonas peptidolytica F12-50-A1]NLR14787.1 exodeoxyribonuclease V subunit beta [Pseudoalteromonas peptidolytica]GEK10177.1 RecBCD enzyme subunit RecB [Pseudoalteromonas peptidolytica]